MRPKGDETQASRMQITIVPKGNSNCLSWLLLLLLLSFVGSNLVKLGVLLTQMMS